MTVGKLSSVSRSGLVQQAISTLRTAVSRGTWGVGEQIPVEAELAEQLGVGRNTVREAVRALVHAGILETRQGQGTFVVRADELGGVLARVLEDEDLRDVMEVRRALEAEAAGLAATRRTERQLAKIRSALEQERAAFDRDDREGVLSADTAFHRAIAEATNNRVLIRVYGELLDAVRAYVRTMRIRRPQNRSSLESHERLVEAITDGDSSEARQHAVAHFATGTDEVGRPTPRHDG